MGYLNALIEYLIIKKEIVGVVVSVLTLIVATWALFYTAIQVSSQRKYNRLMVHPHLDDMSIVDDEGYKFYLEITNNGVGPAVFYHMELYYKDELVTADDPIEEVMNRIVLDRPGTINEWGHESSGLGSYLKDSATTEIIRVGFKQSEDRDTATNFKKYLQENTRLKIWYRSIYGDEYLYDSRGEPLPDLKPLRKWSWLRSKEAKRRGR